MTEDELHRFIGRFLSERDEVSLKKAENALVSYLYLNFEKYRLDSMDEDIRSDFILWLYPRLSKIITQYDSSRSSFRTYLGWMVSLSYRTFRRGRYSSEARQKVIESEEAANLNWGESEEACFAAEAELSPGCYGNKEGKRKSSTFARKVFLLACKSSSFLDEEAILRVIRLTGYDEGYVRSHLEYIRRSCLDKQERIRATREKQYAYYIRTQQCKYEMKYLEKESKRYLDLDKEYRYCSKRLEAVRKTAITHIQGPSNRFLARTLGMCRGTIDSALATAVREGYCDAS